MSKVAENLANMAQGLPAFDPWRVNVELAAHLIEQQAARIAELEAQQEEDAGTINHLLAGIGELKAQQRGGVVADEREAFEESMGAPILAEQGKFALSRAYDEDRPYTFLATKWAWKAWQARARLNPPGKFRLGDPVRKIKGSQWSGRIVGTYSTELTPEGYAVESFTEKGSVQIYPAAALEACEEPGECVAVPGAWRDVQAERQRQISAEGWTPEHDDEHDVGELAAAGAAYALHAADHLHPYSQGDGGNEAPSCWPWHDELAGRGEGPVKTEPAWWKPGTPRRNLIKAGALILAEIERLDRAQQGEEVGDE